MSVPEDMLLPTPPSSAGGGWPPWLGVMTEIEITGIIPYEPPADRASRPPLDPAATFRFGYCPAPGT